MLQRSKKSRSGEGIRWVLAALLVGMILVLAACGPSTAPESSAPTLEQESSEEADLQQEPNDQISESGYPPPQAPVVEEAYPVEPIPLPSPTLVPGSYPPAEEVFAEPRFRLDLPLSADDRVVNGQAPPNLALAVVDVSSGGGVLGVGVVGGDGRFSIGVRDLPEGHRVGITFSELQPGKTHAEMSEEYFPHRGEGFMNIPNIGIFFDSTLVEP